MKSFRSYLIVSLVKGMTYGIVFVAALVAINANVTTVRSEAFTECFNPHTAQITQVATGQACPKPINPYK